VGQNVSLDPLPPSEASGAIRGASRGRLAPRGQAAAPAVHHFVLQGLAQRAVDALLPEWPSPIGYRWPPGPPPECPPPPEGGLAWLAAGALGPSLWAAPAWLSPGLPWTAGGLTLGAGAAGRLMELPGVITGPLTLRSDPCSPGSRPVTGTGCIMPGFELGAAGPCTAGVTCPGD